MKLATWNVNSLKVRLPQGSDWLAREQPDVLCLQELKLDDRAFPVAEVAAAGYQAAFSGQKTYNGVAILARPRRSTMLSVAFRLCRRTTSVISATIDVSVSSAPIFRTGRPSDPRSSPTSLPGSTR